jgi:hypothetical protein
MGIAKKQGFITIQMEQEEAKRSAAFQTALNNALAKQDLAMADGVSQSHQGKVDTGIIHWG